MHYLVSVTMKFKQIKQYIYIYIYMCVCMCVCVGVCVSVCCVVLYIHKFMLRVFCSPWFIETNQPPILNPFLLTNGRNIFCKGNPTTKKK